MKVFTTGMPGRGMLKSMLQIRKTDEFVLGIRKNSEKNEQIKAFLKSIEKYNNWTLKIEKFTTRVINIKNLLGFPNYNKVDDRADIYINLDIDDLGIKNRPLITLLADLSVLRYPKKSSLKWLSRIVRRRSFKRMAKYSDKIVVISNRTGNDLIELLDYPMERIIKIYNGINTRWFKPIKSKSAVPEYWIWWGNITPRKNLDGLIKSMMIVQQKSITHGNKVPRLILVASGPTESIRELIKTLNLEQTVAIYSKKVLEELIDLVDESIGLIFPSHYEGFGIPLIETMARGKKVICSDLEVHREVTGNLATYVDCNNYELLADQILAHSNSDHKLIDAHRLWANQFTYEKAATEYSNIIMSIVNAN